MSIGISVVTPVPRCPKCASTKVDDRRDRAHCNTCGFEWPWRKTPLVHMTRKDSK